MNVREAIKKRRSYRSLKKVKITQELIEDLANSVSLAPSCYNNQPWRYVFVYGDKLKELHSALATGNDWAKNASLIVAIFSQKEYDCVVKDREYYLFDVGLSVENMILRATELDLVTHLMAGYSAEEAKDILNIPDESQLIALMAVGGKTDTINPDLSKEQQETEKKRPERLPLDEFVFHNNVE